MPMVSLPDSMPAFSEYVALFYLAGRYKDFFREYLSKHLFPFANEFSNLVCKQQQILASGEGVLGRGDQIGVTEIEPG
jgi:hypothetical protein